MVVELILHILSKNTKKRIVPANCNESPAESWSRLNIQIIYKRKTFSPTLGYALNNDLPID